jgi:hypothetical protein
VVNLDPETGTHADATLPWAGVLIADDAGGIVQSIVAYGL